jgi:serine protease Do
MNIRLGSPARGLAALAMTVALAACALAAPGLQHAAYAQSSSSGSGYVGVLLQDLNDDLRDSYNFKGTGVLISDVTDGSPADRAGLRRGDIVTSYRGRSVSSSQALTDMVRADKAGDRVAFTVWREGKPNTVTLTLGSREDMPREEDNDNDNDNDNNYHYHSHSNGRTYSFSIPNMRGLEMLGSGPRLGVETQDLDSDLGSYFNRPDGKGVLVTHVLDDTPAKRAGIRSGDVIIEIDGKTVDDADDLRSDLRDKDAGPVKVTVLRKGTRQTLTATLEERRGSMSGMNQMRIMTPDGREYRSMTDQDRRDLQRQMDDLRRQMEDLRRQLHDKD